MFASSPSMRGKGRHMRITTALLSKRKVKVNSVYIWTADTNNRQGEPEAGLRKTQHQNTVATAEDKDLQNTSMSLPRVCCPSVWDPHTQVFTQKVEMQSMVQRLGEICPKAIP